eukprot:TRINITY_DN22871_c0_g1_i2.p1 TRINITY_DN22871_c0_g1~~TRINITY_DN22871_c0_g1_i2.p1  ORF type:complete len:270 (+),score=70.82 TRINITY_DN22871_c0_g1_i2:159-968(+)
MCIRDRVGSAMGSAHMVGPVLLAEIAPPKWRGSITLCHQLVVTVGILFAKLLLLLFGNKDDNIDGCHCLSDASLAWMHAVLFIPPIIQLACQCWMPESPRIVLRRHGAQLAAIELEGLRPKHYSQHDAQDEMVAMMEEFQAEDPESWLCAELMGHSQQMWIGGGLLIMNGLTGINTVVYWGDAILTDISGTSGWFQVLLPAVDSICTLVPILLIDRVGRTRLLRAGTFIMAVSVTLLGLVLSLIHISEPTRLLSISYAVFCLKKKKKTK